MKRAFPLQAIADLSALRLEQATRRLADLIGAEQAASERLRLLEQYRQEYQTRFLAAAEKGVGPADWRNYHAFLARLEEAIELAKRQLSESNARAAAGKQQWLEQRARTKAFDALKQRHAERVMRFEAKLEQKVTDEHAARRHAAEERMDES
ncbi:MAG: flagellar export protein FliJ [Rhodocyclaceae bacterium]|nr:flagellar export protein FliJ [Rhodocyclaceae bacterium]